ncbi:MAG: hypothetical protein EOP45_00730 [Sphingobacteriaceae bacterium]|nr:MAG: hypothetical protein EOP45_00730 [Sphingobacteriaceae bacterium]
MPRKILSLVEKINNSETKVKALVEQRHRELLDIIKRCNAITVDDSMLMGFLMFAVNKDNKDHPMLKQFKELAVASKPPSRPKGVSNNRAKAGT